jgi:hypothetical protein
MRLDVAVDGPCPGVKVFYNGAERRRVFVADEEQRLIVAAMLDEQGRMQLNRERDDVKKETLCGDVRIELPGAVDE